ncbi:hypothetical protein VTN00DRAFT_3784 [Thermoascus crustaceus]|uniref:uncharacterized protein n=1 Tax=Thermoascus crustaceus TaxID=5088 RepID=UPI003744505B
MSHTAGFSKVGQRSIYEADNQRNVPFSEIRERQRYKEGPPGSHMPDDTKDKRSISNRLGREEQRERRHEAPYNPEAELSKMDPTAPAVLHGNQPSRGAQVDKDLQYDDELRLREKGYK